MNAKFTITLYDTLKQVPNFFDFIDFIDEEHTNQLINSIRSMWDIYEIAGESISEQLKYMTDTYNEYKSYYAEKINEYDKKLEWTEYDHVTTEGTSGSKSIHSDLPNKQIDPDDYFAYPTDTDKGDSESSTTTTDKSKLIYLRKQYINQIKDYYREFALRFANDFIHMY